MGDVKKKVRFRHMDNERLAKVFVDINSATSIAGAILETICGEDMVDNDRVIWLISGAL